MNSITTLPESVSLSGMNFSYNKISYTYDEKGNILTISENWTLPIFV